MDPTPGTDRPPHEEIRQLAFLLGSWRGAGEGTWPPGDAFRYGEEMTFEHTGDAFLLYAELSWALEDAAPLHAERGFFRPGGAGRVEVTLAHPLGIVEVAEGTLNGGVVDVASTALALTTTGSNVTAVRRRIEVEDDALRYELWMAMRGESLVRHLAGELERV
jgi:hypothetical protein